MDFSKPRNPLFIKYIQFSWIVKFASFSAASTIGHFRGQAQLDNTSVHKKRHFRGQTQLDNTSVHKKRYFRGQTFQSLPQHIIRQVILPGTPAKSCVLPKYKFYLKTKYCSLDLASCSDSLNNQYLLYM